MLAIDTLMPPPPPDAVERFSPYAMPMPPCRRYAATLCCFFHAALADVAADIRLRHAIQDTPLYIERYTRDVTMLIDALFHAPLRRHV